MTIFGQKWEIQFRQVTFGLATIVNFDLGEWFIFGIGGGFPVSGSAKNPIVHLEDVYLTGICTEGCPNFQRLSTREFVLDNQTDHSHVFDPRKDSVVHRYVGTSTPANDRLWGSALWTDGDTIKKQNTSTRWELVHKRRNKIHKLAKNPSPPSQRHSTQWNRINIPGTQLLIECVIRFVKVVNSNSST